MRRLGVLVWAMALVCLLALVHCGRPIRPLPSRGNGRGTGVWRSPIVDVAEYGVAHVGDDLLGPTAAMSPVPGAWLAVWSTTQARFTKPGSIRPTNTGRDSDVVFARSSDGGASWSPAWLVDDGASQDSSDEHHVSIEGNRDSSTIAILYHSFPKAKGKAREPVSEAIVLVTSINGGLSFTPPRTLAQRNTTKNSPLGYAQIQHDGGSTWVLAWGDAQRGVRVIRSTDNCASWTAPVPVAPQVTSPFSLLYSDNEFIVVTSTGSFVSRDGVTWSGISATQSFLSVASYANKLMGVAVNAHKEITFATSIDGARSWGEPQVFVLLHRIGQLFSLMKRC